uniref:RED-like N-terminal domain-containing protein n=1 Tax=Ascaris lumbricoides TaxID=6252 RepID=A0A9J2Q0V5_ASCLU
MEKNRLWMKLMNLRRVASNTTTTLRNEDFRQLLSRKTIPQPTSTNNATFQVQSTHSFSHRQANESKRNHNAVGKTRKQKERNRDEDDDDDYGILDGSNLNEILKNYRDRAEERRKGIGKEETADEIQASNAYRAVPADIRATADAAQRRKQAIQESKYLGGDMEHTHLVKGLDYSLLHKVRSEIALREQKGDDALEAAYNKESQLEEVHSDNRMVRNMLRLLFQNELPLTNELFRKGRMAYVVELEEEENDLPTTRLRSVHDCPVTESTHDINTSNMLIQKLTQVLSYLRADTLKKKKKAESGGNEEQRSKLSQQPIFDEDVDLKKAADRDRDRDRTREKDRRRAKPTSYFDEAGRDTDRERDRDRARDYDRNKSDKERERGRRTKEEEKRGEHEKRKDESVKLLESVLNPEKKGKISTETEGYAECYPDGIEMYEAAGESDDEVDYSKMDMGNRRGPIKRWDFDDHEEYEKYMESREAMPKAAYQFGVKTNDGRKTRKSAADKEKHKLDREFSEIAKILEKRKLEGRRLEIIALFSNFLGIHL